MGAAVEAAQRAGMCVVESRGNHCIKSNSDLSAITIRFSSTPNNSNVRGRVLTNTGMVANQMSRCMCSRPTIFSRPAREIASFCPFAHSPILPVHSPPITFAVTDLARAHIADLCALIGTQHRRIDELSAALRGAGRERHQKEEVVATATTMSAAMGSSKLKEQQQQQQDQGHQEQQHQQPFQHQQHQQPYQHKHQRHVGSDSAELAMRTRALNMLQLNDDASDEHGDAAVAFALRGNGSGIARHETTDNHAGHTTSSSAGTSSDLLHNYYAMRSHAAHSTTSTLSLTPRHVAPASTAHTPAYQPSLPASLRPSPAPVQSTSSFSSHALHSASQSQPPQLQPPPPPQSAAKLARREIVLRELHEMRAAAAHEVQRAYESGRAPPADSLGVLASVDAALAKLAQ